MPRTSLRHLGSAGHGDGDGRPQSKKEKKQVYILGRTLILSYFVLGFLLYSFHIGMH